MASDMAPCSAIHSSPYRSLPSTIGLFSSMDESNGFPGQDAADADVDDGNFDDGDLDDGDFDDCDFLRNVAAMLSFDFKRAGIAPC